MAEEIIQLRKSEYQELLRLATLNEEKISEEARGIWEREGISELEIVVERDKHFDYRESIDCSAFLFNKRGRFELPYEFRERIGAIVGKFVVLKVEKMYGEAINNRNSFIDMKRSYEKWFRLAWLVAVSGWIVAAILIVWK